MIPGLGSGIDTSYTGRSPSVYYDRNSVVPNYSSTPFVPVSVPNPDYKQGAVNYDLAEDQALEKWGKSKKIVAKDAPEGFRRNLAGLADFLTLGVRDFDKRGNLFGGEHLPGLAGGSGYGGEAVGTPVPKMIPNPDLKTPGTMGNQPLGSAVPNTIDQQLQHYTTNYGLRLADQMAVNQMLDQRLSKGFDQLVKTRRTTDPMDVNFSTAMQQTPFGKAKLAESLVAQTAGLTAAATDAAQRKESLRRGLLALKQGAIGTATAGLNRTMFGSSGPVSMYRT